VIGAAVFLVVALVTLAVGRLEPAAPTVERSTVWIGTVERGPMLRQVRGNGTLVPKEKRWVPAQTSGRVERLLVDPGAQVGSDDVLLELSNPEVERAALDAASALRRAEAELESLRADLVAQELDRRAATAAVQAEHTQAELRAQADRELARQGLVSSINLRISESVAGALATRLEIEEERLSSARRANAARLAAKEAEVDQQRSLAQLRREQLESLRVRAGLAGVVQVVAVEVGQQVAPGTSLARVAEPSQLEAEVRVPAVQARDVQVGQKAVVDTRNGMVDGRVARIDPSVREGTVTVEIELVGPLPRGARPDLNVDGTIEIERLDDVLYVGRPAFGEEGGSIGLFRILADDEHAVRATVRLGRCSVNTVEVVEGLDVGDRVILSDTSRWDDHDRIRLK
jgi:HlyD family secretion protein